MQPNNQRTFDTVEHHIRGYDPLETVGDNFDDEALTTEVQRDIARIDGILATDPSLSNLEKSELYQMGANLRLDWLYAEHGGRHLPMPAFAAEAKKAEAFITAAAHEAHKRHERHPQDFWALQTKLLDLRAFTAHRFAADSQTTLKGTEQGTKLFGFSQDIMKTVLADSIRLMRDMEQFSQGDNERSQDARGSLYELLLITYSRLQTYNNQSFDTVFVRSALSREDRPWNDHVFPKRAFDIVVEAPDHTRLLQAKNHRNHDAYEWPIHKVEDEHFRTTLENVPKYISDLSLLLDNPRDPLMQGPLMKAQRRLDGVFGTQLAHTS